jgi:hypothetical protein
VNPPVLIWDATASKLFLVVEVRRQDDCLGLRLCFAASHAASVAGVSSVTPGVLDRTSHEQTPREVEERQAAIGSRLAEIADALVYVFLHPVTPHLVHVCGPAIALAIRPSDKAKRPASQEFLEFGAWAVAYRCWWLWVFWQTRHSWEGGMLNVYRPLVAILRDYAWQNLVERVATLKATGQQMRAVAFNHGSGLVESPQVTVTSHTLAKRGSR